MAVILRKDYNNLTTEQYPVLYVDSINESGYISEMFNITMSFIRIRDSHEIICNKDKYIATDTNDILINKNNGLWVVYDEKLHTVTLYERKTSTGYIYNSNCIEKIFELTYHKCPRSVPIVFKKENKFESFDRELKESVSKYRMRSIQ